jgi:hypothetical protein
MIDYAALLAALEPQLGIAPNRWPDRKGKYHADCPLCNKPAKKGADALHDRGRHRRDSGAQPECGVPRPRAASGALAPRRAGGYGIARVGRTELARPVETDRGWGVALRSRPPGALYGLVLRGRCRSTPSPTHNRRVCSPPARSPAMVGTSASSPAGAFGGQRSAEWRTARQRIRMRCRNV